MTLLITIIVLFIVFTIWMRFQYNKTRTIVKQSLSFIEAQLQTSSEASTNLGIRFDFVNNLIRGFPEYRLIEGEEYKTAQFTLDGIAFTLVGNDNNSILTGNDLLLMQVNESLKSNDEREEKIEILAEFIKEISNEEKQKQEAFYHIIDSINSFEKGKPALRLQFKNIGQAMNALWDNNIETINVDDISHFVIDDKIYGIYVSSDIYIDITDFSYEDEPRTMKWLENQKLLIEDQNKELMKGLNKNSSIQNNDKIEDFVNPF